MNERTEAGSNLASVSFLPSFPPVTTNVTN
jgi:hypothetical protein